MPCLIGQNDGLRRFSGGQHRNGLLVNAALHILPLAVELAELAGKGHGARRIVREKQLCRNFHMAHPTGGVDSGGQRIADGSCRDGRAHRAALGHERRNADPLGVCKRLKPLPDHFSVLACQWHHVRHGSETKQIAVFRQQRLLIAVERGGQFERHANARHLQNWLRLFLSVRVDDCDGLGKLELAFMVVGDDELHAKLPAQSRLLVCRNAAVDGDDQLHILLVKCPHGNFIEPVAFFEPCGNVACHMSAALSEKVRQKTCGRDAVYVVVSEHADMLAPFESPFDPRRGLIHIEQVKGGGKRHIGG